MKANTNRRKVGGMLGVGLDAADDQTRVTKGKNFFLVGGSKDTHSRMQETAIRVNEQLDRRGKSLENVSVPELRDIFSEVSDSIGKS